MSVWKNLLKSVEKKGSAYLVLIDPESAHDGSLSEAAKSITNGGADGILVGGSLLNNTDFDSSVAELKSSTELPVIIFPGSARQVSGRADMLLYLSLLSGRNAEKIIGEQVRSAMKIKELKLETVSTAYLLIESGGITSAQFMSGTMPIPREKEEISVAHSVAAELLGMKAIYLEAGSGAKMPVPLKTVTAVCSEVNLPVIVGGGINSPEAAELRARAGASFIVTGTVHEGGMDEKLIGKFAKAVHWKE